MEGTTNFLTEVVSFFKDTILVMLGDTLSWAASNDVMKYFLYISLIAALVGIVRRVRHSI